MRRPLRLALSVSIAASAIGTGTVLLSSNGASAAAFAGGDVVVYQVGNGTTPLSNVAAPVNLEEYAPAGGSPVQTIALPTADSGGQHALTATGLSTSEGEITRSPDGRYLTVTGYDAAPGTNGPVVNAIQEGLTSTTPSSVARTVGRVDGNGLVDTSTALGDANTPSIVRSATTTDGTHFYVAGGNGGLLTASLGATTTAVAAGSATSNLNGVSIQGSTPADSLVFASASDPTARLYALQAGTLTKLPGVSTAALPYGYQFLDLGTASYAGSGLDTLYLIDAADRAGAVDKYVYNGTTWVEAGTIALDGALGLAAAPTGAGHAVSLDVTTVNGLYTWTDPNGTDATHFNGNPVKIASAPADTQFRGVAIAPVVPTGPSIVVDTPAANAQIKQGTASTPFKAAVADSDGIASVTVAVDSGSAINATQGPGGDWNATLPLTGLALGKHTLKVTATDNSASHLTSTVNSSFTITSPPIPKGDVGPGSTSLADTKLVKVKRFKTTTVKGAPTYKGKHLGLTTKKKGTASFSYIGGKLALHLVGTKASGEITVTIDGKKKTINLYSKKTKKITVTFHEKSTTGTTTAHKVSIAAIGKKTKKSKGTNVTLGWVVVSK